MSETPQERWRDRLNERLACSHFCLKHSGPCGECELREDIRALQAVLTQREREIAKAAEAERDTLRAELRRAEKFWASAQERADVANVALLDAVKVRGQLRAAEAALLDAQHQEAQDIEALDKLGNAYDAAATAWGRDEAEYIREIAALRGVAR